MKKGMIRAITGCIGATMLCLAANSAAANIEEEQACVILSQRREEMGKHVMNVSEMCKLLGARMMREKWELKEKMRIDVITISMDEISEKEKSFENKVVPVTEEMNGRKLEVVYWAVIIKEHSETSSNTVIESKHIRAMNKFLLMFEGSHMESLFIDNKKLTHDKEELQRIREIIHAAPRIRAPMYNMKYLWFYSTSEANTTHPLLLQIVIQTMEITEIEEFFLSIAATYVQQIMQVLGSLRCKKLENLQIEIKNEEQVVKEEEEMTYGLVQSEQDQTYEIERLEIISRCDEVAIVIPAWLVGKPKQELSLDMSLYMRLNKQGMQNIRARIFSIFISNAISKYDLEKDTEWKKKNKMENVNAGVKELKLIYNYKSSMLNSQKETIYEDTLSMEYIRCNLAWIASQFPGLTKIKLCWMGPGLINSYDYQNLRKALTETIVDFEPWPQNLTELEILGRKIHLCIPFRSVATFAGDFSAGLKVMPFVMRPRLWKAFVSGQLESQINKQQGLKKNQHGYIQIRVTEAFKNVEQFTCSSCRSSADENEEPSWIYVAGPCRKAFCLKCMIKNYLKYRKEGEKSTKSEKTSSRRKGKPLQESWRNCWLIEETINSTYIVKASRIENDSNGNMQILGYKEAGEKLVVKY